MIEAAYLNPTAYGDLTGVNFMVWLVGHLLVDQKFMPIFSMLFGAGIVLMADRRRAAGRGGAGVHFRRMGVLLVFGLLHARLLWYGDILYSYAVCGLVVYLFRNWRPRSLVLLGILSICVSPALMLLCQWSLPHWKAAEVEKFVAEFVPPAEAVADEVATYRGGWWDQMDHRWPAAWRFETFIFLFFVAWRTGGLMLVGMALFKLGVFSARRSAGVYSMMIGVGLLVGVPIVAYGVRRQFDVGWDPRQSLFLLGQYNYWGSLMVSAGWVGLVVLICRGGLLPTIRQRLAAMGRLAFTHYLLQTVICTLIFYGHGLGLFGRVERIGQIGIVVAVSAVQLASSPIWLQRFRMGPAEWLWRSLVYMKAQPLRRAVVNPCRGLPGRPLLRGGRRRACWSSYPDRGHRMVKACSAIDDVRASQ